ncbi:MAG: hypothetical protein U0Y96_17225 [Candidatus Kapaibacterium sp.]
MRVFLLGVTFALFAIVSSQDTYAGPKTGNWKFNGSSNFTRYGEYKGETPTPTGLKIDCDFAVVICWSISNGTLTTNDYLTGPQEHDPDADIMDEVEHD